MYELSVNEYKKVNGGYDMCDFAEDATVSFFTAGGGIIGAATGFGAGGYVGGAIGNMVGGWASDILLEDMGCEISDE